MSPAQDLQSSTIQKAISQASTTVGPDNGTSQTGLIDLETELTCSICTDILYQPLTLLDCLHTFCGSCLKEWFHWQKDAVVRSSSRTNANPFTCPSCRASVRETRPNATVTTLVDMYIQANPTRAKPENERVEIAKVYKPGDKVVPDHVKERSGDARGSDYEPGRRRDRRTNRRPELESEDARLVQEATELNLREAGIGAGPSSRQRDLQSQARPREDEHGRTAPSQAHRPGSSGTSSHGHQTRTNPGNADRATSLEHQSSLRSLISISDMDSQGMEEEIMRQIAEEGLLDGIDLSNIDQRAEEEISERIAQVYRRRTRERRAGGEERARSSNRDQRHASRTREETRRSGPPISRPHLLDATADPQPLRHRHRRSTSHGGSASSSSLQPPSTDEGVRQASRSATDLSERPATREGQEHRSRRVSEENRRSTDPQRPSIAELWQRGAERGETVSRALAVDTTVPRTPVEAIHVASSSPAEQIVTVHPTSTAHTQSPRSTAMRRSIEPRPSLAPIPVSTEPSLQKFKLPRAPSLSCSSCRKGGLEYQQHYVCHPCTARGQVGRFVLCRQCYINGNGCRNWYGFGRAAMAKYERAAPKHSGQEIREAPHTMLGEQYLVKEQLDAGQRERIAQGEDPLAVSCLEGVFCDSCQGNANACYWRCDTCNDGAWGYCSNCVNQDHCCIHPLSPFAWGIPYEEPGTDQSRSASSAQQAQQALTPHLHEIQITTTCNSCHKQIPPSVPYHHCSTCNSGDHDICHSCWAGTLVDLPHNAQAPTSPTQPTARGLQHQRCENNHSMSLLTYHDRRPSSAPKQPPQTLLDIYSSPNTNYARRDLLSQQQQQQHPATRHRHQPQPQPPSSSASASAPAPAPAPDPADNHPQMQALWTRLPDAGVTDELAFPRGAVITGCRRMNADWCHGAYCGRRGLFPAGYARELAPSR